MAKKEIGNQDASLEAARNATAGLKWLYEAEALNSPALLNNLYGNIYSFPNVSDCEILIDRYNRKMLIYVKFTFLVRKLLKSRKKDVIISILDQLQELLPSFEFRIIEDKNLFDLAVQRMHESLSGGKNVEPTKNPSDGDTAVVAPVGSPDDSSSGVQTDSNPATVESKTSQTDSE